MTTKQAAPGSAAAFILLALVSLMLLGALGGAGWLFLELQKARAEASRTKAEAGARQGALERRLKESVLGMESARAEARLAADARAEAEARIAESQQERMQAITARKDREAELARSRTASLTMERDLRATIRKLEDRISDLNDKLLSMARDYDKLKRQLAKEKDGS